MQPLGLTSSQNTAYLNRLFSSHDYRVHLDVLDMNETPIGSAVLLDGQVNMLSGDNVIRRTATFSISDPTGALDFSGAASWSGSTVWVDRLIRVRHVLTVPGVPGGQVTTTPFIGVPSKISRNGADVAVECQDKTALAVRGSAAYTVNKGTNAVGAIRSILQKCTGEFRFRLGSSTRRLSKPYSVGLTDETSPWTIATRIARSELGMQLIYSCDGYATLRRTPSTTALVVPFVTDHATSDVDFTSLVNYVRVLGKVTTSTKKSGSTTVTSTTQPIANAQAVSGNITPTALSRKGVRRYLPLVITEEAYSTAAQVKTRATSELAAGSRLDNAPKFACVPFFHADPDDIVRFNVPGNDVTVRLGDVSIPLGPGEMSVGTVRWVSAAPRRSTSATYIRTRKTTRKK